MFKEINKYKVLLYLAILGGNIGEVYSIEYVYSDITIGDSTKGNKVATGLTNTDYNYWSKETGEDNTYVFYRSSNNNNTYWRANKQVTIDTGYTLKLITDYNNYSIVLDCYNTFTNNGNVIIDDYGRLDLNNYTSNNNGTIDVINGVLVLWNKATLTNTGTITLQGSSDIDIYDGALNNTGTIRCKGSSSICITSNTNLTNTCTIDISNITDLSYWCNEGTFTLEEGSIFILPKSTLEDSKKIGSTGNTFNDIQLKGTIDKPVNIVIPKYYKHKYNIDVNNKDELFKVIQEETGLTFGGETVHVEFSWQTDDECGILYVDECD